MTWPKRYGGGERICSNAMGRTGSPRLLRYGTQEQRLAFLPGIAKGEIFFCIGMSDSGSDLASIRTRAVAVAAEALG